MSSNKSKFKLSLKAFKKRIKTKAIRFEYWLQFRKRLFLLWWHNAPQSQKDLEKGAYYLRKGTIYQIGQPFKLFDAKGNVKKVVYIENLYYNFRLNKVTHRFSHKPIKGLTEHFEQGR